MAEVTTEPRHATFADMDYKCEAHYAQALPLCYHFGMSKQIAVRLPDELVDFVDEIVHSGTGRSRATVVTRALERERRRMVAARDAEILARTGPDPELAGLAEHAAGLPSASA
jgi:Arc/MetJ-type ribon-helix-helix transcriptional regulator